MDSRPKKPCKWCKEVNPLHFPFQCRDNPKNVEKRISSPSRFRSINITELKPCEYCESTRHYTSLCPFKPKPPIKRGVVYKRWTECKKEWFKLYGMYHPCHYCGIGLKPETITLDHLIPRSRAPALRYDFDNLVPCCGLCNTAKGSVAHDEYVHTCH